MGCGTEDFDLAGEDSIITRGTVPQAVPSKFTVKYF